MVDHATIIAIFFIVYLGMILGGLPATREQFERQGAEPVTSTPEEMLKFINAE